MPYNNVIDRTDASALIPEDVSNDIWKNVPQASAAMSLFRPRRLSRNQQRVPVLATLPTAYFVNGDTGLKQTTEQTWANKFFNVEEVATIVPIPEAVLEDADFDIWAEIRPNIVEAIGRTIDNAIFFGVNKPASWPTAIVTNAVSAGNTVTRGTNPATAGGLAGDLSDAFALVEVDGYDVNGIIAHRSYKGRFRQTRDANGQPLLDLNGAVYGITPQYPLRGLWPSGAGVPEVIVGDFTQAIMAVRKDITYKMLTEAVIQDNTGAIVYNLAQQDMVAMRVVIRVAWQVANPINYDRPTEAQRYPFAVVVAP
jgi:HK97 family phage major capsid protein